MRKMLSVLITSLILLTVLSFIFKKIINERATGAPPYAFEDLEPPEVDNYTWLRNWERPEGPAKVGLQVGHWKNDELPDELKRLKGRTGSSGGGKSEWEVNLSIAQATAEILRSYGIQAEILPSTVPSKFWADVFVAIHADGSNDSSTSGFKAANPRRDYTGNAEKLLKLVEAEYQAATDLPKDPNVTRNMRGYYAFAWWRYEHAVHPMTASLILETGFLTNPSDRKIIVSKPEVSARGLANGIIKYLESENILQVN
ncbi:MAG: Cell wall hydrolase/autolysin [Candidatus Woesebacteria bacterium GW2011_GWB1_38_8]|uniref:Cell wall hydrolase/autolysin n=1 Tax=Candidatus Woesebacteria bacterium GW2011_GWB1_38_8 TaxID=1618570 RepID=A0A0G0KZ18_9BACT|nr:MAG: Cell wall hydrolase/autolysin [Candidatus Woesebacteria bacterium GW2011_GWB1_38_8]